MKQNKLKQYNKALRQGASTKHILKRDDKWIVKRASASRAARVVNTQKEAITIARGMKSSPDARIVIHSKDGLISRVE